MAIFIPPRSTCKFDTTGERRLAERLAKKLDKDYICWFNIPVGPKARQPDFLVLHPLRGFLVLEVKDWKLDTIQTIDKSRATLLVNGQPVKCANPMVQARTYALETTVHLERDPLLRQESGPYQGKLLMPYGWGVVLSNITRKQFNAHNLADVLDSNHVICSDEMTESVDAEEFQQRLWNMFYQTFSCSLSSKQIDRIRYHLYPEVRINPQSGQFGLFSEEQAPTLSSMQVMDFEQEQLARSLGDGHRVIHGVAGSGKTMILVYRSQHLANLLTLPVLVLCYNKSLAGRLRTKIKQASPEANIEVMHFHGLCSELRKRHQVPLISGNEQAYIRSVKSVKYALETGQIPKHQYGAILIDEAHDFEAEWFSIVMPLINPETNSLLVLYDDAQAIYKKKNALDFRFSDVGIQAQGRTKILRLNYRNTIEILTTAKQFADTILAENELSEDQIPTLNPSSAGRQGELPNIKRFNSETDELRFIADEILTAISQQVSADDIAVLYQHKEQAEQIEKVLKLYSVPCISTHIDKNKETLYQEQPTVKIVSLHSSKGLEFSHVFIPYLNRMPKKTANIESEGKLLYVGLTRAVDKLTLTCHGQSIFSEKISLAITQTKQLLLYNSN